jgi:protein-tyrosine phosphatase
LIEPPFTPVAVGLDGLLFDAMDDGHRILIAHPERCPAFHREPHLVRSLVEAGALTSITAGALVGRFGRTAERFARMLFDSGLAHNVSSDAHAASGNRGPDIAGELERAGLSALAEWLTVEIPSAILGGEERVPPRPPVAANAARRTRRPLWRRARLLRRAS